MSLTCQVQLVLSDMTREKADAVRAALEPDNVDFPEGLSLEVRNADDGLVLSFESRDSIRHLIGTIDEVMDHIGVALRVME